MTAPIIVTGPQRAGSRIAANILAHDLGGVFVDELEYSLPLPDRAVVQAPFLLKAVVELSYMIPNVCFAFMYRSPGDIVQSMERIEWYQDYATDPNFYTSYVKHCYEYIDLLKQTLRKDQWFDVQYESLKTHPLFVQDRTGFTVKQHLPNVPNGPTTWRNDEYIRAVKG
jgi:hypothetical protein